MKIAIVGKMRSGKDTIGNYLIKRHGFTRFAFAQGITNILNEYFPEIMAEGKPRGMYQDIGQDFRGYDPDVWIKYTFRAMSELLERNNEANIVITDTRQMNEFKHLKANGFTVIKVCTSLENQIKRIVKNGDTFNMEELEHETEKQAEAMPYDYLIINDGTPEELFKYVEDVIGRIMEGGKANCIR